MSSELIPAAPAASTHRANADSAVGRRGFLATSAAAGAVVLATSEETAWAATGGAERTLGAALPTLLPAGVPLGEGWQTVEACEVEAGALRILVEQTPSGRKALVLACLRVDGSDALARTPHLDLFLMNNGSGRVPTPADEVRMVEALGRALQGTEARLARSGDLLGQAERLRAFDPIDHVDPLQPANHAAAR